ncbi:translation initiation factor IF-2-like [Dipodomys spectabilis]|uniref:translation initiation factor IF-2-like n=1 Tax=Dipodomys spectabilis TaxID=105255 RepID=UPI001C53DAA2|nr:translation initiation factor IF-2-like [Dipodomys spectabilis]
MVASGDQAAGGGARAVSPRGLRPPGPGARRGLRATGHAARPAAGERPARAPAPAIPGPTRPGRWADTRERKKGASLGLAGRSGAAENREKGGGRGGRVGPAPSRVPPPRALPSRPLLRNFFLWLRPTRKVRPGRGRRARRAGRVPGGGGRPARRKWCPRERGWAEEMPGPPAGPPPAARPAPDPRPAATLAGSSRRGGGDGVGRCGPAAPRSQQCRAGKTKGLRFAFFPVFHLRSRGAARDPLADRGRAPKGSKPRVPRLPRAPPPPRRPRPPARPPRRHQARRTPACSDFGSREIRPYCPRAAPRAPPGSPAAPARSPTELVEPEPGAPRKPSPRRRRRRRCPPDAAALRVFLSFYFFFPNPDGKEGDRLLRIHQLSSQQQKSRRTPRPAGAIGGGGGGGERRLPPCAAGPTPRSTGGGHGPGARTKDVLGCRLGVLRPPPPGVAQ